MSKTCVFCLTDTPYPCKPVADWRLRMFANPPALVGVSSHEHCAKREVIRQLGRERLNFLCRRQTSYKLPPTTVAERSQADVIAAIDFPGESASNPKSDATLASTSDFQPKQQVCHQRLHCLILGARQVQDHGSASGQTPPYLPKVPSLSRETFGEDLEGSCRARSPLRKLASAEHVPPTTPEISLNPKALPFFVPREAREVRPLNPEALPFWCPNKHEGWEVEQDGKL